MSLELALHIAKETAEATGLSVEELVKFLSALENHVDVAHHVASLTEQASNGGAALSTVSYEDSAPTSLTDTPVETPVESCDVFDTTQEASIELGVDCEAGAIEGLKALGKEMAAQGAELDPSHPLYPLLKAAQEDDSRALTKAAEGLSKELDMWKPDLDLHDPHGKESALLVPGTTFSMGDDGTMLVKSPSGAVLASIGCDGTEVPYTGPMINSEGCGCYEETGIATPDEPVPAPEVPEARIQTLLLCNSGTCFTFGNVLIFDSVADAQNFFANPDNVDWYKESIEKFGYSDKPFVIIADGEGSAQCLRLKGDTLDVDTMFAVEMNTKDGHVVGHLPDGALFEEYAKGYMGTDGPRTESGVEHGIENGETLFPSAPQKLIFNPETGLYEYEDINDAANETANVWLKEAGIDSTEWNAIKDMPLPVEFADNGASVAERAQALKGAMAARGVTISTEDATELTRIITEGQGNDAGLNFNEMFRRNNLTVPATENGQMISLNRALADTATNGISMLRNVQSAS